MSKSYFIFNTRDGYYLVESKDVESVPKPRELVRTQEEYFRTDLKGLNLNDEEWIKVMVENPKLIHRPIVEGKYKAVLGDPVENIDKL